VLRYLVKRILLMFVTLFGITLITFLLTRLTPGDPAANRIAPGAGGNIRAQGGFDDLVEQTGAILGWINLGC
jgi:ABC-type dipeptide/oligopeptide/nickel transport system permease component